MAVNGLRILELPGLPPKGDIIDWLADGHTGEELMELTQKCPKWELDQEQSKAAKWETPQPFHSIEVPDFPSDVLPGVVGEYVLQEAEAKQVPVDLPACLALGAIAGVVAGKYQIKLSDDWSEPLNLFIACALPSGERKSPEFRDVLGPIETYERAKLEEAGPNILKKQTERDILEWRLKNAKGAAAKGPQGERIAAEAEARALAEELANFKMPSSPRLLADDATPEAVSGLLAEQNGRLMIASTEGGIFDIIGGRYSDGAPNLDVYLKAYSGDPIRVDRRSRPAEIIPNPALTVLLTVQPSVITDLVERRTFRGRGLLARILYSLPKSMVGYRSADALPVDAEVKMQWSDIVTTLLKLPLPNKEDIPLLTLSSEAAIEFRTFRERVEIDLRPGGELDDLADWGNKLPGNVARFAGLIHLTSWSGNLQNLENSQYTLQPNYEPIGKKTMEEAIRLGHYFEVMAKAAFALMGADAGVMEAKRVWSVIDQHNLTQFSVSKLLQKHLRRSFKNSSALKVVLDNLEELGYVRRVEEPERESRGRSPSPVYETNPRGRTLNSDNSFYSPDPANLQNLEISQYKEVDTDEDVVVRA